jgi:hypothetical protein
MSVATANAFSLLDDEGTVDASELAAKLPVPQKEAPKKAVEEPKQGESRARPHAGSDGREQPLNPRQKVPHILH